MIADLGARIVQHAPQSSSASIRLTSKPCWHPLDGVSEVDEESKKKQKADDKDLVGNLLHFIRALS